MSDAHATDGRYGADWHGIDAIEVITGQYDQEAFAESGRVTLTPAAAADTIKRPPQENPDAH